MTACNLVTPFILPLFLSLTQTQTHRFQPKTLEDFNHSTDLQISAKDVGRLQSQHRPTDFSQRRRMTLITAQSYRFQPKTWEDFNHSKVLNPLTSPEEGTKSGALSGERFQNPGETKSRKWSSHSRMDCLAAELLLHSCFSVTVFVTLLRTAVETAVSRVHK